MNRWSKVPFGDLLLDSKDGEWGEGAPGVGLLAADMIRGTDFAELNSPAKDLPRRYVAERHVTRKRLQVGDIVFEMAGGTAKQSTGRSALITKAFLDRRAETPVLCASFCRHLRLDQSKHESKFVYYLLQALYDAGYMSVFNIQHTGVSRFQYTSFKKHTVLNMPELHAQQKIAAILSAYDDLIANNQRRIALLERIDSDDPTALIGLPLAALVLHALERQISAGDLQVHGFRTLAATVRLCVVGHFLIFGQSGEAGGLYGGDMDENIRSAFVGLDETKSFVGVEELDCACIHGAVPFSSLPAWRYSILSYARKRA